jgi:hypothetical protein
MATQSRIGWRPYVTQVVNAVDADATAFIAAAGITNLTQAAAISTLVNDLKTYGLWTKMKALYPMVGGSAASHKFNLKDPRDVDAAYRLAFSVTGWTHTSTGAKPNGTSAYANTFLAPNAMGQNNAHLSSYSRTNSSGVFTDIGSVSFSYSSRYNDLSYVYMNTTSGNPSGYFYDSSGFFIGNRTTSTVQILFRNTVKQVNGSNGSITPSSANIYIGAGNTANGTPSYFSNRETAFASVGDGLSDTEATNFYNSVQKFQTTLGRQIGSPIVSDTDAQAFINAAGLTDLGQANAVNTLVVDLKAAGVWAKMKALYPFVGGTATAHKFNLKDPRDLNEAFRLVFSGGWVHNSTGALSNGTTGYADPKMPANQIFTSTNGLMGVYTSSTSSNAGGYMYGVSNMGNSEWSMYYTSGGNLGFGMYGTNTLSSASTLQGLSAIGMETNGYRSIYKNDSRLISSNNGFVAMTQNFNMFLAARNAGGGGVDGFASLLYSFSFISSTLTLTEYSAFYTAVQKYQTSLGRQVGTSVLADGQTAGLLETYTGSSAAYSLRKLRTEYYGAAIRVRRSSDNTEQDIAFKTNGTLDTVGLTGFVGSGDGFVTTWYDQSGNGKHAYQISASNQPRIVLGGVIDLINNKPSLKFTNGQMLVTTQNVLSTGNQPYSIYGVSYNNATADSTLFFLGADNLNVSNQYLSLQVNTNGGMTNFRHFWGTGFGWSPGLNTNNIQQYYYIGYDGSTKYSSTNNTNLTNTQVVSMNLQSPILKIGQLPQVSEYYKGYHQELILFNSNSSSTTTGIKSNINSYYTIY